MASCYLCGRSLSSGGGIRKWVPVSRSQRLYVGRRGRIGVSGGTSQGLRTVCANCSAAVDRSGQLVFLGFVALIAMIGLIVWLEPTPQPYVYHAPIVQTLRPTPGVH